MPDHGGLGHGGVCVRFKDPDVWGKSASVEKERGVEDEPGGASGDGEEQRSGERTRKL